jgi:hypothetical protein
MDWINLALDRDQWQALMNTILNVWVPEKTPTFPTKKQTISSWRWTLFHGVCISCKIYVA